MPWSYNDVAEAYHKIQNQRVKFGVNYKTIFHLHTPQSYDYKLKADWTTEEYNRKTELDLLNICISKPVLPNSFDLEEYNLEDEFGVYQTKEEWLAYVLLAFELLKNEIEIVLVSDHNTISEIDKLRCAINDIRKLKAFLYIQKLLLE